MLEAEKLLESFFSSQVFLRSFFDSLNDLEKKVFEEMVLIGQAERIFSTISSEEDFFPLKKLIDHLIDVDRFYENIGGIEGYHQKFISFLKKEDKRQQKYSFLEPFAIDIYKMTNQLKEYIDIGLLSLPQMAEIYPLGGAGDRLDLIDEKTNEPLPQAKFNFLGKTLIEHMILDLTAREYLYFKTYHEKVITPIVIMTSDVKNNNKHVLEIFEQNDFFGRPRDSFFFIKQLSVPLINEEGDWVMKGKFQLDLKPGGHGVLWSLMNYHKVFDWLYTKQRTKALIRQINNPVAAVDYNILAFSGYGIKENKLFGFASCPRRVQSPEGMNVLKEKVTEEGFEYNICNIEYTDFKSNEIEDQPLSQGSPYSKFPSNTNTLFVDLEAVRKASLVDPLPGIVINLKNSYLEGKREIKSGRLELLMQGIADNFVDFFPRRILEEDFSKLSTFITKNIRRKTISVIKNPYTSKENPYDTPMGTYFDVHQNYCDILTNYCNFDLPTQSDILDFLSNGPSFICYINPLLGPLYVDIGKKLKSGKIKKGAELRLDLSEVEIENLFLDGSLQIYGHTNDFNKQSRCRLVNIKVINKGIDYSAENSFYQNKIVRKESLKIILHANSIFEAVDVSFEEDQIIEVPPNTKIIAFSNESDVFFEKIKLY